MAALKDEKKDLQTAGHWDAWQAAWRVALMVGGLAVLLVALLAVDWGYVWVVSMVVASAAHWAGEKVLM